MDLHENDVISMHTNKSLVSHPVCKFAELLEVRERFVHGNLAAWLGQGVECEILRPGQPWVKGRMKARIVIEFEPEFEGEGNGNSR